MYKQTKYRKRFFSRRRSQLSKQETFLNVVAISQQRCCDAAEMFENVVCFFWVNTSRFFSEDTNIRVIVNLVYGPSRIFWFFITAFFRLATVKISNVRFPTLNCRAQTLERSGCGGLGTVGQAAIAIAFGTYGELQRGWRDAGLPHRRRILPESSPGELKCTFLQVWIFSWNRQWETEITFKELCRLIKGFSFLNIYY